MWFLGSLIGTMIDPLIIVCAVVAVFGLRKSEAIPRILAGAALALVVTIVFSVVLQDRPAEQAMRTIALSALAAAVWSAILVGSHKAVQKLA